MVRRGIQIALIVTIATLQCVSSADVDDARQTSRDGRTIVEVSGSHGAAGVARAKGTAPTIFGGGITSTFVLLVPPATSLVRRLAPAAAIDDAPVDVSHAPRPPPALA